MGRKEPIELWPLIFIAFFASMAIHMCYIEHTKQKAMELGYEQVDGEWKKIQNQNEAESRAEAWK